MTNGQHILSAFDEALVELKETTLTMGAGAQKNLNNAIHGLLQRNKEVCNQAIADDEDIDVLQIEIDRMGMTIIAKYHPVAIDLRTVIASMKTAANLERISDQSVNIAKRARSIMKNAEIKDVAKIEGLYKIAATMLSDAMTAYSDSNAELAVDVIEREKEIKKAHKQTSRALAKNLEDESKLHKSYLDLVFICRWLERVGSLSINIAEDVIFEETSTDVRHGGDIPEELKGSGI